MSKLGEHSDFRIIKNVINIDGQDEPLEVQVYGADEIFVQIPEATEYQTHVHFVVLKPIKNLTYTLTAVKAGITVKKTVLEFGSYEPREEPYVFDCPRDKTPSGFLLRGKCPMTTVYSIDGGDSIEIKWTIDVTKK